MKNRSLARRIADKVQACPDKTIFRFLERGEAESAALSYGDVDREARQVAAALVGAGMTGERVLLVFEPGPEFVQALIGCLYAGAIGIPAPAPRPGASLERLEGIAAGSRAKLMLSAGSLNDDIEARSGPESPLRAVGTIDVGRVGPDRSSSPCPGFDTDPSAPVLVQYTSGSTLRPRGVALDSAGLGANIDFACRGIGFGAREPETFVNWMPHYHDMGLIGNLLLPLAMGWTSVHMPPLGFVQNPLRWLKAIDFYRGTSSGGPPLAYDLCVARLPDEAVASLDLSSWRIAFCGAEPVFAASLAAFRVRFARAGFDGAALFPVYGLAEVGVYAGGSPPGGQSAAPPGPAERALCSLDEETRATLRIVSADGAALPEGEEGEIWISSPSVAAGYLDDPEATERTFRNGLRPDDGRQWLRTGDLGVMAGGMLNVTGRIKDVLIRNGVNIAATDVERLAAEGRPRLNPNGAAAFQGEGAAAPIVLLIEKQRGAWDESEEPALQRGIRRSVMDGLGVALDEIGFVEPGALPRTTSGKIQRARARAEWLAARAPSPGEREAPHAAAFSG